MYSARYGTSYLHDPFTDDTLISDLSISATVNQKGSASFTMAPSHPLYSKIQLQDPSNSVYIYDDDVILFDGYIIDTSLSFDGTLQVSCDGALGYLEQCRIRPYATSKSDDDDPSTTYIGSSYEHYVQWVFDEYNKRCDCWKRIKLGKNEATQLVTNNTVYRANSTYPTFAEEIEDKILDSPGGYLFLRHEGSTRYVDYFKDCVDVNAQIIDFGVNLLDFTKSDETSDMATAIIPVGKTGRYLVDGAEVEHMNLLEDTGGWTEDNKPSKWSIDGGSESNNVEMVTIDGLNCLHRIGSVGQQSTSLRLEWNTEYTWQCKIKFASSGTVEKNNPIHCWCIYTNESSEMSGGQDALSFTYLKVQDLDTGWVVENVDSASLTANHWYLITQRFKTISQYSSYKYCLFRPWIANGLGDGEWWMHWMKLEKGVTPTDWSAFPENAEMTEVDLTISNLGDGGTSVAGFYIDGDKVIYKPSRDTYGTIETEQDYSDIGDMNLLVTNAITDLISVGRPVTTIDISAIDLALIDGQYKSLVPGQLVRIRSKPHNVDEYMMLSEMNLDLSDPSNTTYTFGITYDSLTGQQSKKIQSLNAAINKSLDSVSALSTDVKSAAKDADKAMDEAKKAYDASTDNAKNLTDVVTRIDSDISDLQKQVDGAIETWFYDHEPGADVEPTKDWTTDEDKNKHLGDLYYDTNTGYCYRWQNQNGVYSWSRIADTDVTKALDAAKNAQDTADHKRTIFVDTPTAPYEVGDLWVQGESGDILRCMTAKSKDESYSAADWSVASKYTDDTKAEEANAAAEDAKTTANEATNTANEAKEAADKAATSIVTQYAISESPMVEPISGWSQTTPTYADGQYIWMRQIITYGSGEVKTTAPVLITGNTGAKGEPGEGIDGKTTYLHIAYANSEDGVTDFSVDDPVGKSYIGQYTDFDEDDSTDPSKYAWTKIKGETGDTGKTGASVTSVAVEYYLSTSNTTQSGGSWQASVPEWESDHYIWQRSVTTIKMEDGTTTTQIGDPVLYGVMNSLATTVDGHTTQITQNGNSIDTLIGRTDSLGTLIHESSEGIEVGKSEDGETFEGYHTLVGTDAFKIHDTDHTEVASFDASNIKLGEHSIDSTIDMLNGAMVVTVSDTAKTSGTTKFEIIDAKIQNIKDPTVAEAKYCDMQTTLSNSRQAKNPSTAQPVDGLQNEVSLQFRASEYQMSVELELAQKTDEDSFVRGGYEIYSSGGYNSATNGLDATIYERAKQKTLSLNNYLDVYARYLNFAPPATSSDHISAKQTLMMSNLLGFIEAINNCPRVSTVTYSASGMYCQAIESPFGVIVGANSTGTSFSTRSTVCTIYTAGTFMRVNEKFMRGVFSGHQSGVFVAYGSDNHTITITTEQAPVLAAEDTMQILIPCIWTISSV